MAWHEDWQELADRIRDGRLTPDEAARRIAAGSFHDLGCARVDTGRAARTGMPEAIFCAGKTVRQVLDIAGAMLERNGGFFGTRADAGQLAAVHEAFPQAVTNEPAGTVRCGSRPVGSVPGLVGVITAGTSDLPVAEEAKETLAHLGVSAETLPDVGVAGVHRLAANAEELRSRDVLIVVAGMEGALPSIIGGLVACPVIAVPTSIGYGSNFEGLSALLGMLNSCASGLSVVNIDNGFGAACAAYRILASRPGDPS